MKSSPRPDGLACTPQHLHAEPLQALFPQTSSVFDAVIVTVRDPVARVESEYRWLRFFNAAAGRGDIFPDFSAWLSLVLDAYPNNPFVADNHIRPQSEFLIEGAEVFRLEDDGVARAIECCCRALGVAPDKGAGQLHEKATAGEPIEWTPTMRDRFMDFYRHDFETLSYKPEFE